MSELNSVRPDFIAGVWSENIDVRDFIQLNYTPYLGDADFLTPPTERTLRVWDKILQLFPKELKDGVYDVDTTTPATITAFGPGYISQEDELIVGLQTDAPLKCAVMPNGSWRTVQTALTEHGYTPDPKLQEIFTKYRKTHNEAVFDVYPASVRAARSNHIITGLPDSYGRGRIIGDYRRVALYGVDALIAAKKADRLAMDAERSTEKVLRDREENVQQIKALNDLKTMAASYGYDISRPAVSAREAVQWLYFAYLGAIKEQDGAAMSLGRTNAFLDIFFERDINAGLMTERDAQELIDDFVIKLRIVRFLRQEEYKQVFSGNPYWVTESLAGMGEDGRTLVTKTSFRFLHTLYNLGPAPEPNLTVLWSSKLPQGFKDFCAKVSIDTSAIQYESDELIRAEYGDDAAIACCVSPMRIGKQMQFFGARVNLVKALLYSINGGKDEVTTKQVGPVTPIFVQAGTPLDYNEVMEAFDKEMDWLAQTYIDALNCIHRAHDRWNYEALEMSLHDREILRTMACGIAGLSVVADSLSAIKYAKVFPVIDEQTGLVSDYLIEGDFPKFGNDDDSVDSIAVELVRTFMSKLRAQETYRDSKVTESVLTITSSVVYGKATGNTPDGRRKGEPFAPGANPMNGRDTHGMLASALSVAKIPYEDAQDGISLTATTIPSSLGRDQAEQVRNLVGLLDAVNVSDGYHLNINVLNRETLVDAMENPENYPQLTIRVSGYAVNFVRLTREQQLDVLSRTFHSSM